ncbi:unnamed protein product [Protopolystoma xenopodis]|uniref:Conserved oligomeric Golgi complex subunit 4 C-terminal domain-containing protein n=1 Tax=Protopolystoma xenopodis TaxID=117903 RepID=A0A3S5ADU8_9PLAT|nr:unnamed protein product [Protopolystoma xenopodis]
MDKELRFLLSYLTSISSSPLRDYFTRLLQISTLLNLDKVDEVTFYWTNSSWRLNANEVKRILSLRVDFMVNDIRRLQL